MNQKNKEMKIIITGSLGNISKPLIKILLEKGHNVTIISRDPEKKAAIEEMGAEAAIGSLQDISFLSRALAGADAVYTMVPPVSYLDPNLDPIGHFSNLGKIYAAAIGQANVR
ncbi:MAG: NAD-dependent dehydratase, partial [Sphingobacteriaceae bacterium]